MVATHDTARGLARLLPLALAALLSGCGGPADVTGGSRALPEGGKRHREMEDFMKTSKPQGAPAPKVRDHP